MNAENASWVQLGTGGEAGVVGRAVGRTPKGQSPPEAAAQPPLTRAGHPLSDAPPAAQVWPRSRQPVHYPANVGRRRHHASSQRVDLLGALVGMRAPPRLESRRPGPVHRAS